MSIKKRVTTVLAASATAALALTACSTPTNNSNTTDGKLHILASFYPLQFVSEQVGGDLVSVESLTPQGAEPHDLELSPAHTRGISKADLVVYQAGFQKAVDEAIAARAPQHVYDASKYAQGTNSAHHDGETAEEHAEHTHDDHDHSGETAEEHAAHSHTGQEHAHHDHADHDHAEESEEAHDNHGDDDHGHDDHGHSHDGHDHGATDPHFWLDPTLLAATAPDIAQQLAKIDPENAETYHANATKLVANLTTLDQKFQQELSTQCTNRTVVVTHEAFGYLAARYNFSQLGITGIDPEGEPSPAQIKKVREQIQTTGTTTIFFETLSSPKVAETLAKDLGITTAVLDPLEGLVDPTANYLTVMEANLAALKQGMNCA